MKNELAPARRLPASNESHELWITFLVDDVCHAHALGQGRQPVDLLRGNKRYGFSIYNHKRTLRCNKWYGLNLIYAYAYAPMPMPYAL